MMAIDFECGATHENVGMTGMALNAHLRECEDEACKTAVREMIKKYA